MFVNDPVRAVRRGAEFLPEVERSPSGAEPSARSLLDELSPGERRAVESCRGARDLFATAPELRHRVFLPWAANEREWAQAQLAGYYLAQHGRARCIRELGAGAPKPPARGGNHVRPRDA